MDRCHDVGSARPNTKMGVLLATVLWLSLPSSSLASAASFGSGNVAILKASATLGAHPHLVRFKDGSDPNRAVAALAGQGRRVGRIYRHVFAGALAELTDAEAAALRSDPEIATVEPDSTVTLDATQTNPPWGLDRVDQRPLPLSGTYSYPEGAAAVTAYIVDSGIRATHVDFAGRVRSGVTVVDDGLGTADCHGHGTHVAGTVAGSTYGIAKTVTLVPVRVLDCSGSGSLSGILAALEWIINDHIAGTAAVVNMSLGGPVSSLFDTAVANVVTAGVSVVVSAGNDGDDACEQSPAHAPDAITVAATDGTDTAASWSNQGTCVDLFAPGVSVTSDWNTSDTASNTISGTSMASPHVAGAVAVLLGQQPSLSPAQVTGVILSNTTVGVIGGVISGTPNRLLYSEPPGPANDAFADATLFQLTDTSPLAASNVGATREGGEPEHAGVSGTTSVWWTFTAPSDGTVTLTTAGSTFDTVLAVYTGTAVTALTEVAANDDEAPGNLWSTVTATVTDASVYRLAVDGHGGGSGDITLGFTFTPVAMPIPDTPTITAVTAGDASATVSWAPPNGDPTGIDSYVVRAYAGSTVIETTVPAPAVTTLVSPLQNGRAYTFTVAATTSGGTGPESAPSDPVIPHTVPAAPTDVNALPGDGLAIVTWTAPAFDGGAPITSYTVTAFAGTTPVKTAAVLPATAAVMTDLVNGTTYAFTVAARNAAGPGPRSTPSAAVTPTEPAPEQPELPPLPSVNHPPVAVGDTYELTTGTTLTVLAAQGVLANDLDVDGDVLTAAVLAGPSHGTLVMDLRGAFSYTPAPGWAGLDTVVYEARDGLGGVGSATITFETTTVLGSGGSRSGYWMLSSDGVVYGFGTAQQYGNGAPAATDLEPTPAGDGYWILNASGVVAHFGAARNFGGSPPLRRGETAASLSVTPSGNGYWIVTTRGRVFPYGDAPYRGDMSGVILNGPVLDSVATPSGQGYWMVASDGGIFSFGDATFFGSMGSVRLNQPVMSMAADPDGTGYWLVASDGGIFAFQAPFHGSMGGIRLNKPVCGMVPGPGGYLMVAEDGGIFAFGNILFQGSLGSSPPPSPVVAVALAP